MECLKQRLSNSNTYVRPVLGSLVFMGYNSLAPSNLGGHGGSVVSDRNLYQGLMFVSASLLNQVLFAQGAGMGMVSLRAGVIYSVESMLFNVDSRGFIAKTLVVAGSDYVACYLKSKMDAMDEDADAYADSGADEDSCAGPTVA